MGQLTVTGLKAKINLIQVAEILNITIFLQDLLGPEVFKSAKL